MSRARGADRDAQSHPPLHDAVEAEVRAVVAEVLGVTNAARRWTGETRLLGSMPEFDSMAVVAVVTSLEQRFGVIVEDDELSADVFQTVGSLSAFVRNKLDG